MKMMFKYKFYRNLINLKKNKIYYIKNNKVKILQKMNKKKLKRLEIINKLFL